MTLNQNSGYGQAIFNAIHAAVGAPFGNVHIVMNSSDSDEKNFQHLQELFSPDFDGNVRFFTSLSEAYDACESNNNDVIILDGNSTHTLTSMLTVAKNRVHFIGLDWLLGIRRRYGQSSKVSASISSGATNIATIKVTGVRCSFRGIKFINSSTVDEGLYCFADGGEFTYVENCEIYKSTDLDQTGAAELLANGDGSYYKDCYIGSTANAVTANGARPCVLMTRETITGKVARDVTFEGCIFARKCGDTDNRFIYGANANDVERMCILKDCIFVNSIEAAQDPAQAIEFGASLTSGAMLLKNCAAVKVSNISATTGVFTSDPQANAAGGEAVQYT